jgi:hypothetical protein
MRLVMNAVPSIQQESLFAHGDRQLALKDEAKPLSWMDGKLVS